MADYRPRVIDDVLAARLERTGAVLIEGPKACGKTETASQVARSVVRLDVDEAARSAAAVDPSLVLSGDRPRLVDEWQRFPRIWDHVRRAVDEDGTPGQFILTASASPADDVQRHSGAGRVGTLRMRPMSLFELGDSSGAVSLAALFEGRGASTADVGVDDLPSMLERLVAGGWPGQLAVADPDFVRDYLEQTAHLDVPSVGGARRDPARVMACLRSIARNVGTAAGTATIAADAGIARPTADAYLDALRRLMVVEDQPAFSTHLRSSRNLRSTPVRHFVDPSLAAAAMGADAEALLGDLHTAGLLFESLVVRDLRVLSQPLGGAVTQFRTDDHEIDAVVQLPTGTWGAVEVKLGGEEPIEAGARSLRAAADAIDTSRMGDPAFLAVVTAVGSYAYSRADGVAVVPLAALGP